MADFFDGFIFVSEEVENFHYVNKLIKKEKVEVIPNSVPFIPIENASLNNGVLKLIYVSRLSEDKFPSILFFINCIEEIVSLINVEITIVGQGNKYSEVLDLVEGLNKKTIKNVAKVINGSVNVIGHMQRADVVVGVGSGVGAWHHSNFVEMSAARFL